MVAYTSSLQHLLAELERLDLLIRVQVWRARQRQSDQEPALPAFCVSDAEVDEALDALGTGGGAGRPSWADVPIPPDVLGPLQARLDQLALEITQRAEESRAAGVLLRLDALTQLFDLGGFDRDVVLVCLAPELDRRYERLYGYLHDDLTRRHPSVDLVLGLLCPDVESRVAARSRFGAGAPLVDHQLLRVVDDAGRPAPSLLGKSLQLDPRVARYVLDDDQPDERLRPFARLVVPSIRLEALAFPSALVQHLAGLAHHAGSNGTDLVV